MELIHVHQPTEVKMKRGWWNGGKTKV